jgi:hypothetical protein
MAGKLTAWKMVGLFFAGNSAGLTLLVFAALVTFFAWRHTRYFGTSAPLLTCAVLVLLLLVMPSAAGFSFLLVMLPFAIVFAAGVCADLIESHHIVLRSLATGVIIAVLLTHALFNALALSHVGERRNSPERAAPHARIRR